MEKTTGKYAYFAHTECEFFPCHEGADREKFNCLFCFCPLYDRGENCGGNFRMLERGIKDCSDCLYPHLPEKYDEMIMRLGRKKEEA